MTLEDGLSVAAGILVVMLASAFALWPLLRRSGDAIEEVDPGAEDADERSVRRQALYREVLDLEFDLQTGKLSTQDYQALTADLLGQAAFLLRADCVEESVLDEQIEQEIALARAALAQRRPARAAQEVAP